MKHPAEHHQRHHQHELEELTPETWTAQLLSLVWQFLLGLLELLQLAWAAVTGGSGGLGVAAKKDDDIGGRGLRRPVGKRRGAPHVPVMVVGGPALKALPPPHPGKRHWHHAHHGHPHAAAAQQQPAHGLPPLRGAQPAHSTLLSPRETAESGSQCALPRERSLHSGALSPRHAYHMPPHPQFVASPAGGPPGGGRPGSAVPKASAAGGLLRQYSLPVGSAFQQQREGGGLPLAPSASLPLHEAPAAAGSGELGSLRQQPGQPLPQAPPGPVTLPGPGPEACASQPGPPLGCPAIPFEELELAELVGEGGFAKVYRARLRGEEVAVKLLNPESSSKPSVLEEFRREVAVLASLGTHPNIVRLVGAVTAPPHLAVVTQYCSGGSLYALLHSPHIRLTWGQLVEMCLGVARGMQYLHSCGVLHRDLKSGNLLLDADGSVKLADFGLSRMAQQAGPMTGGLGTYQWMAPEVLGHQRYSERADVYSFAMFMWECAARQVPYTGMDGVQAALAVMNRGLRPDIPPHTPAPFARLMQTCWAPTPDQRPSFAWVVAALEGMVAEVAQQAQQQGGQQQGRPGPREEGHGRQVGVQQAEVEAEGAALCDAV